MKQPAVTLFWLVILGGVINYYITVSYVTRETEEQIKQSYTEYLTGEKASTLGERQDAFNRALALYTGFERDYSPKNSTGKLYYNIANSYYQVGEHSWAALYYYRAQKLMPRSDKVVHSLEMSLKKLGIVPKEEEIMFRKTFPFHYLLSLPERLQLFSGLTFFAIVVGSFYIWKRKRWLKKIAILATILASVMLLSLGYSHYLAAVEGVLVKSTALYRDAGLQYAKVTKEPILSGNKVEILDVLDEGKWLKIETPEGDLGYVPQEAIRII
ncbi:MAG: hypothetical protein K940chlam7_00184 [Chlamydiae bacterium]|nr:hypothetical protein [Chlamydiota bacterium]